MSQTEGEGKNAEILKKITDKIEKSRNRSFRNF